MDELAIKPEFCVISNFDQHSKKIKNSEPEWHLPN